MASYKRGPLAGIEYRSERQKRNAREYLRLTGVVLQPDEADRLARGMYGRAQSERNRDLQFIAASELGIEADVLRHNRDYFWARWQQQNEGRIVPLTRQDFERTWRQVLRDRLAPGTALDHLLEGAGMRTGLDENGQRKWRARLHYMQFVIQKWEDNELETLGSARVSARIAAEFGEPTTLGHMPTLPTYFGQLPPLDVTIDFD